PARFVVWGRRSAGWGPRLTVRRVGPWKPFASCGFGGRRGREAAVARSADSVSVSVARSAVLVRDGDEHV
ncbi:MAG: hypothetical protein KC586_13475, partial [Myxococcales bacterium]|nr:hypothetical protein [Myxococcales bacterium]